MRAFRHLCGAAAMACGTTAMSLPARAQVVAGDLFATEYGAGTVVNFAGGGSFSGAPRFATGLSGPMSLCVGPGGELYAAEFNSGEVTVITDGGDFDSAAPFAWGLSFPCGLTCSETEILAAEFGAAQVTDITDGGDMTDAAPFAYGGADWDWVATLRDSSDNLWVSRQYDSEGVYDITAGGDVSDDAPYVYNADIVRGLAQMGATLLLADNGLDQVIDFTAGGDLANMPVFATVPGVLSLHGVDGLGLFAGSDYGSVYEISAGGDFTDEPPFATGVAISGGYTGLQYVHGCGDGVVHVGVEDCDEGGVDTASCDADCTDVECSDEHVNAAAGEDCDDGGESASCDADCTEVECGDSTRNSAAGDECDDGNTVDGDGCSAQCADEGAGGAGGGGATGGAAGSGGSAGAGGSAGSAGAAGSANDADSSGSGCGCRTAPADYGRAGWLLVAAGLWAGWGRRRGQRRIHGG